MLFYSRTKAGGRKTRSEGEQRRTRRNKKVFYLYWESLRALSRWHNIKARENIREMVGRRALAQWDDEWLNIHHEQSSRESAWQFLSALVFHHEQEVGSWLSTSTGGDKLALNFKLLFVYKPSSQHKRQLLRFLFSFIEKESPRNVCAFNSSSESLGDGEEKGKNLKERFRKANSIISVTLVKGLDTFDWKFYCKLCFRKIKFWEIFWWLN